MISLKNRFDTAILGVSAYIYKAQTPIYVRHHPHMDKAPLKIVSENLSALAAAVGLTRKNGEPSQSAISRKTNGRVDQRTVGRILSGEMCPTIDKLDELASAFGLRAWQLLVPNLDPENPPVGAISRREQEYHRKIEALKLHEPPPHRYF